jgi:acid phosphatase (class A)
MTADRLPMTGLLIAGVLMAAACSSVEAPRRPNPAFLGSTGPLPGYLAKGEYPDNSALLPPPPAAGSAAIALDETLNQHSLGLRGTSRWDLAAEDARTKFPDAARTFSCALGVPITEQDTPSVYILFRRSAIDVGMSVRPTKKLYQRARPFLVNSQPTCTPSAEKYMMKDGSYPSGHAAAGWAWALILAEIAPDRTDAVLTRGRQFGQSRAVCNVHWQSDVTQGRIVGAAVIARLHANTDFRADLQLAHEEIEAARARGLLPDSDCEAEAKALATDALADRRVESN